VSQKDVSASSIEPSATARAVDAVARDGVGRATDYLPM
jgi:hypothetical protein